ncbi:UNVERIFIED_CONTAM: hypothetical protein FKN15_022713 [Acipenser sinensis]
MAAEQEAEETVSLELHSPYELRIMLFGRSKSGNSSSGNTILSREEGRSGISFSERTRECEKRTGEVAGRRVTVVDTPDLLDTDLVEIERCVSLSAPGPHAFLLVIPVYPKDVIDTHSEFIVERYCEAFDKVQELFGERAVRHTMVLFNCGDLLKGRTIEQYIEEAGEELQQLVEKCGNRYHVLNNRNRSDRTQVTQLLDKIDTMVMGSGGCYTIQMYSEAKERAREVRIRKKRDEQIDRMGYEKSKLLEERPGELELQLELRREREKSRVLERELKRAQEGEQELKKEREKRRELEEEMKKEMEKSRELEEELRREREKRGELEEQLRRERGEREKGEQKGKLSCQKNEKPPGNQYLRPLVVFTGGSVGAAVVGAVAGAVSGPKGAAAGVFIGAILGAAVGATLRRVTGGEVGREAVKETYKTQ